MLNKSTLRILGIYLVGGYGVVEFVGFIVNHYMLSRNLIDVSIITMLSMIPSVLIIAYYESKSKWTRIGKISIPVNFIVTISFLFILFHNKELGATTTTITLEDEEGNKIERVIPKSEFRKEAVIFFFDNEAGDPKLNWLQYGIVALLDMDLSQDLFLDITIPYDYSSELKEAGFAKGVGLPLTLKRKIADEDHYKYFVSGVFSKNNGEFSVETFLYETKRTKLLAENTFNGKDIFKLTDEISIQIKRDLEIPVRHIEEVTDLPVSEISTNSMTSLELAITGYNTLVFDDDWENGLKYLQKSIEEDPTFAFVHEQLLHLYLMSNMSEKREETLELVMKYLYKFPENKQYEVKAQYHAMKGNPEKQLAILKMWSELYPDDIDPHDELADYYWRKGQYDEIISEYKRILELAPEEHWCIMLIGHAYKKKGKFDVALQYYEQYAGLFPDEYKSFIAIGDLYKTMGDYPQAKSWYEKALAMEPEKISIILNLAKVEYRSGGFKKAFKQYENTLELCKTPEDRESVYSATHSLYEFTGQMSKSLEYLHLWFAEKEKIGPQLQVLAYKLFYLDDYIRAGKKDEAFRIIQTIKSQLQPPYDKFISFGYFALYIELEEVWKAEKALEEFEQAYNAGKLPFSSVGGLMRHHGKINELKGKYADAILNYKDHLKDHPTDVEINFNIGKCYRKLKQFNEAKEYLNKCLKVLPFYPEAHYEIALEYSDMGDKEKALEHLKIALDIWKDADLIFEPAQKAKEKLEEWENSF